MPLNPVGRAGPHFLRIGRLPKRKGYLKRHAAGFQVARFAVAYSGARLVGDSAVAHEYLAVVSAAGCAFTAGEGYA